MLEVVRDSDGRAGVTRRSHKGKNTTRFRWEPQSAAHPSTPAGRRYLAATEGAPQKVTLFVRQRRMDSRVHTAPYLCLWLCTYDGHSGAKPMRLDWDLATPMHAWFFQATKVAGE